ncbi:MAG: hypothetical protein ACOCVF_03640 [bacterium]
MRMWNFGINNLYKTGCYYLEEGPWYAFFAREGIMIICNIIPSFPIPFGSKIKIKDDGEEYTAKDYYGDINVWFHLNICVKIFNWSQNKLIIYIVDADYDDLKEKFGKKSMLFNGENNE